MVMCDVMEEYMAEEREKALKEGQELGKEMLLNLTICMYQNGDGDKIEQLKDPEVFQAMLRKYHLE